MTLSTQSLNFKKDKTLAARHSYSLSAKVNSLFTSLKLTSKQPTNQKAKATSPTIPSFSDAMATKDCTEESPRNSLSHRDSNQQANASYLEASKEKKLYYSPFRWSFDGYLAQYIKAQSLFVLGEASLGQENTFFQIQQNKEKIGKMRDQIELVFQLYYKLMFYNRVRINSSVEINKLKKSMDDVRMVIDTERSYDYENNAENLFVSMNIGEKVYSEYKQILESPIRDIFIPVLSSLKNKYYAQEYLSEEHKEVQTNLETLITGINRTVEVVYLMKKQIDVDTKLSTVTPYDLAKFEKIQNPQQLYAAFVDVVVQIKALSNQANLLPKLRNLFRKYLKLAVILEVYSKGEAKLKELKRRLLTISTRLEKKVEAQSTNMYDLFRRATNEVLPSELPVEECKFDLKTIIDKEECLEYAKVAEMKQHLFAVEGFVRRAEIYCEELASNKNPKKTAQMTENSALYIQQVETTLRGIFYARQKMEEIKSVMEKGSYQEQAKEEIIREVKIETRELAYQVRQSDQAFDLEGWNSSKITAAFHHALDNEYVVKKKWKKGSQKAVHFGKKKMMEKLAEIVRKRRHEKNKIFVSCKTRIESSLNIGDILRFFKSKRQWQAIASPKSHMVLIRDGGVLKEPIFRRIYCNSELESYILKIVRSFVNALAEPEHKSLP